jgi:ribulose-phosphate 3-epimerase
MLKLSPSVLACDFCNLGRDVEKAEKAGVEYLHLDVMDGVFVPNISFGPGVIKALRRQSSLFFDVHLMITDPARYIDDFVAAGADLITIHYESCDDPQAVLKQIRAKGVKAGISVKPKTPVSVLQPLLDDTDLILIMTVEPGFGGQKLIPETIEKIAQAKAMIGDRAIELEADGGIGAQNLSLVTEAGANVIVAGSAIFGAEEIGAAVKAFRAVGDAVKC